MLRKMKILFVHDRFGALGGAEVNIQLTACELKRRGHRVGLLHGPGTGKNEQTWAETFPERFDFADKTAFEEVVEDFAPELIYAHKIENLDAFRTLLDSGIPIVRMVHDHQMYCMRGYKYNYFTRKICTRPTSMHCIFPCLGFLGRSPDRKLQYVSYREKRREIRLNQQCARLVVYSDYSRQELVRNGFDPEKILVHVPIPCEGDKAPSASFSNRNLIIFAGQIIRGKGVDALLEALTKVEVPFECLIIGEGNHRAYCQQLCEKLGLSDRVKFPGYTSQSEMMRLYLDASVLAVSSLWPEPFGMVGPEAMRYGLPVVAFDAGGIREWLKDGENGSLVPWNDTAAFAVRIEQLLNDKSLARRMGQQGRARVNAEYESSGQIARLENLFERVIQEAKALKIYPQVESVQSNPPPEASWDTLPQVPSGLKAITIQNPY